MSSLSGAGTAVATGAIPGGRVGFRFGLPTPENILSIGSSLSSARFRLPGFCFLIDSASSAFAGEACADDDGGKIEWAESPGA